MNLDRFPRDWRVALLVYAAGVATALAFRPWVVGIARAEVQIATAGLSALIWKTDQVYWACVSDGKCRRPPQDFPATDATTPPADR